MNRSILLICTLLFVLSGCEARIMMTANLLVAVVPCALLWLTINLRKEH